MKFAYIRGHNYFQNLLWSKKSCSWLTATMSQQAALLALPDFKAYALTFGDHGLVVYNATEISRQDFSSKVRYERGYCMCTDYNTLSKDRSWRNAKIQKQDLQKSGRKQKEGTNSKATIKMTFSLICGITAYSATQSSLEIGLCSIRSVLLQRRCFLLQNPHNCPLLPLLAY